MFLLDTNICIYLIKKQPARVLAMLRTKTLDEVAISSVTFAELQYGVEKSARREQNQQALTHFLAPLQILAFDEPAGRAYGQVRADLEKRGKPIGSLDLMIGSHALALGATLVTNNTREFKRIRGLAVENWTRG